MRELHFTCENKFIIIINCMRLFTGKGDERFHPTAQLETNDCYDLVVKNSSCSVPTATVLQTNSSYGVSTTSSKEIIDDGGYVSVVEVSSL